jgi:GTPase SAR1 family protein
MINKTTLVSRLTNRECDTSIKATIGASIKSVRLQIWDTAGQERFKTLVPMYSSSTQGRRLLGSASQRR